MMTFEKNALTLSKHPTSPSFTNLLIRGPTCIAYYNSISVCEIVNEGLVLIFYQPIQEPINSHEPNLRAFFNIRAFLCESYLKVIT